MDKTNRLQHSTKLQKLELQGIDISNSGLKEAFKHWPNLVKLKLVDCYCYVTSVAEVLVEGLQHMTKAHHTTDQTLEIILRDCDFNNEAALRLLQAVGDRRLSLTITYYETMDIYDGQTLADALCLVTLPGLIELKLNGLDISNSGLEKALKHWPNLVELELDNCDCRVTSVAEILGEGLQHMTRAHHTTDQTLKIALEDCVFNKEAALGLLQAVGDRRLSLTITYEYTNIGAQPLVDALCLVTLPGLIELEIRCGDDDDNLEYLNNRRTMKPNNFKHSTNLQKLKLFRLDISNSVLEKALEHWPNLVELKMDHCYCHVTSVAEVLGEGLQHMTKAHHTTDQTLEITLDGCDFNKEAALGLLQAVGDCRFSLTITYEYMGIDVAQSLVDALCLVTLPGLIELDVTYAEDVEDNDVYPTVRPNNLKHSTYLQKLKLNWLDISNSGLEKALKHWPNLVELNLSYCHIAASTAVVLGESLQHTSKLQTLRLIGTDISNGLIEGLNHLPNLVELDLRVCHIAASTSVVLGESLQHTSKLQTLSLSNNPIGDDGLHALSLPIKNYCKELKELTLWETQLTDRSITCLTEWIEVLNNLEQLGIGWNHFSEGGVKQIEEAVSERNTRECVAELELYINDQKPLS